MKSVTHARCESRGFCGHYFINETFEKAAGGDGVSEATMAQETTGKKKRLIRHKTSDKLAHRHDTRSAGGRRRRPGARGRWGATGRRRGRGCGGWKRGRGFGTGGPCARHPRAGTSQRAASTGHSLLQIVRPTGQGRCFGIDMRHATTDRSIKPKTRCL